MVSVKNCSTETIPKRPFFPPTSVGMSRSPAFNRINFQNIPHIPTYLWNSMHIRPGCHSANDRSPSLPLDNIEHLKTAFTHNSAEQSYAQTKEN